MKDFLTIGQLSKHVDLSTKTIRYYEEIELIQRAQRSENGYRTYSPAIVNELSMIKQARDLGIPIAEIKKLMKGCDNDCHHSRLSVQTDVTSYIAIVEDKIKQLQLLKKLLTKLRSTIDSGESHCDQNQYCCNILAQLLEIAKGGEKNERPKLSK